MVSGRLIDTSLEQYANAFCPIDNDDNDDIHDFDDDDTDSSNIRGYHYLH